MTDLFTFVGWITVTIALGLIVAHLFGLVVRWFEESPPSTGYKCKRHHWHNLQRWERISEETSACGTQTVSKIGQFIRCCECLQVETRVMTTERTGGAQRHSYSQWKRVDDPERYKDEAITEFAYDKDNEKDIVRSYTSPTRDKLDSLREMKR